MKKLRVLSTFALALGCGILAGISPAQAAAAPPQPAAICPAGVAAVSTGPAAFLFQAVVGVQKECQVLVQIYPDGTASECYCNGGTKCTPPAGIRHCTPDECVVGG
jgi:hypothetical protein